MLHELDGIFDAIPHDQLAIQWDTNFEFAMLDEVMPVWFGDRGPASSSGWSAWAAASRRACSSATTSVTATRRTTAIALPRPAAGRRGQCPSLSLSRSLDWLHLPVAGDRVDLRFFETLAQLALRPDAAVPRAAPPSDGELGARARIVAAQRFVHDFGVATDCGWARHRPQDVAPLIELHRAVSAPIQPAPGGPRLRMAGGLGAGARRRLDAPAGRRAR